MKDKIPADPSNYQNDPEWTLPDFATQLPVRQLCWQTYEIKYGDRAVVRKSMLTNWELQLLMWHSREVKAPGNFVDLGPLTGLSTVAMCEGLDQNRLAATTKIYSYDLFLTAPYFEEYSSTTSGLETGSLFPEFLELLAPHIGRMVCCPGDLLKLRWRGGAIALIFIDVAKSWELMNHIFLEFFPQLAPGSVVVHQDFVWHTEWWIHVYMSWLSEYFEPIDYAYGATCVFRCRKAIPVEMFQCNPVEWGCSRWKSLIEAELTRHPAFAQKPLLMAMAQMLISTGQVREARSVLAKVHEMERRIDKAWHNFEQTAEYNLNEQIKTTEAD